MSVSSSAAMNLLLALGVPALAFVLVLVVSVWLDEPSLAPERGTPRAGVRRPLMGCAP